ncbi:unnamed protein product, partial [Adineta ricciae]
TSLSQNCATRNTARFTDWRLDLLTNGKTIAASRSFQDAFQTTIAMFLETHLFAFIAHLEKYNFLYAYYLLSTFTDMNIRKSLAKLWMHCFHSTMKNLDFTVMDREIIEIELIFYLQLPCATMEYENIRKLRDDIEKSQNASDDRFDYAADAIEQISSISFYGEEFMRLVFNDEQYL